MRINLLLSFLLLPLCAGAEDLFTISGRIVNDRGEAVEYVQVGIPERGIGAISSVDGRFEIEVPAETLEFHHVSYETAYLPVSGPAEGLVIVLKEMELPAAVAIGGDTKEKFLLRPGTRFVGALGGFDVRDGIKKGVELGSVATARKPFLVKNILFSVTDNYIPGCVVSVNIYRIEGEPEQFINVLHKPIYVNVAMSSERQYFDIRPEETLLLEPGKYYISFALVDCDANAIREYWDTPESERNPLGLHLYTPVYFKSSYYRSASLGKLDSIPFNIGISVKGLEYQ